MRSAKPAPTMSAAAMPRIAYGKGVYVYDTDGKQYIDGSGGPTLFCVGHGHPEVG